jgi:hypothetical protein
MSAASPFRTLIRAAFTIVAVILFGSVGCSSDRRLTIRGTVSYKDQPVSAGMVKFYGPHDRLQMAYIRDGKFSMTDVEPGEIKVTVEPDSSGGKSVSIPKKYTDPKTTDLVYTIASGTTELAIRME